VRHNKVVWNQKPNTNSSYSAEHKLRPRAYLPDAVVSDEVAEKLVSNLQPGALWQVSVQSFSACPVQKDVEAPPYPYGSQGWGILAHAKGTIAIYLGTTRVNESNRGRSVSVLRHTFMVEGSIYLVRNITDFEPVV